MLNWFLNWMEDFAKRLCIYLAIMLPLVALLLLAKYFGWVK